MRSSLPHIGAPARSGTGAATGNVRAARPDLDEVGRRAALDEVRHAQTVEALAGRNQSSFGAIPQLTGRRIGGWRRSRRSELRRLAVESYLDGWQNESRAAAALRRRAAAATTTDASTALATMADDEDRHAALARDIVGWCFEQNPTSVAVAIASAEAAA